MKRKGKSGTDRMRELGKRQLVVWLEDYDRAIIDSLATKADMPTATYVRAALLAIHTAGLTFMELRKMAGGRYHVM